MVRDAEDSDDLEDANDAGESVERGDGVTETMDGDEEADPD